MGEHRLPRPARGDVVVTPPAQTEPLVARTRTPKGRWRERIPAAHHGLDFAGRLTGRRRRHLLGVGSRLRRGERRPGQRSRPSEHGPGSVSTGPYARLPKSTLPGYGRLRPAVEGAK